MRSAIHTLPHNNKTTFTIYLILAISLIFLTASKIQASNEPVSDEESSISATARPKATTPQRLEATSSIKERATTKKDAVELMKSERKAMIASKEAELKAKLAKFKDQQKVAVVERINKALNSINTKMTTHFKNILDRLTTLLNKLEARVDNNSADIKDPAVARVAISTARDSIASASAATTTQSEKDYTVSVSSETKAKTDLKVVKDQLMADLKALREQVQIAKKLVANAIKTAKSGKVVASESAEEKEASTSGQQ